MDSLNLNSLMQDYMAVSRQEEARKLARKWQKTGLLEGLENNENKYLGMAQLLENQAKQLITEASRTTAAANAEAWSNVALPLVRRTFGKVVSQDMLSVQPMSLPSGLIFWLEFNYGTAKPGAASIYASGSSIYGSYTDATGSIYDFESTYTKNYISASSVAATFTTASWADFNYDQDLSASIVANPTHFKKVAVAFSALTGADETVTKGYRVTDASSVDTGYWKYTTHDSSNVYFFVSGAHDTALTTVEYLKANTQDSRGDFETGQSGVGAIPEIDMKLRSEAIVAGTRKLKATWTPEIQQDLNAYHAIDAEEELTNVLSEQISMEIDMDNLSMMIENAAIKDYWSAAVGKYVSATDGSYVSGQSFYGTPKEWYQTLVHKMNKVSNEILRYTLRGGANFVVVGTTIATILESLTNVFITDGTPVEATEYALGMAKVGTLDNKYKVYKNPYLRSDIILMGFRGNSFLETGAVFAPYVPLMTTPVIYDTTNFSPIKGVMTRSARKMVRGANFAVIYVRDLHTI